MFAEIIYLIYALDFHIKYIFLYIRNMYFIYIRYIWQFYLCTCGIALIRKKCPPFKDFVSQKMGNCVLFTFLRGMYRLLHCLRERQPE